MNSRSEEAVLSELTRIKTIYGAMLIVQRVLQEAWDDDVQRGTIVSVEVASKVAELQEMCMLVMDKIQVYCDGTLRAIKPEVDHAIKLEQERAMGPVGPRRMN